MKQKGIYLASISGVLYGTLGWFGVTIVHAGMTIPSMLFWRFLFAGLIAITLFSIFFRSVWHVERKFFRPAHVLPFLVALLFGSISTVAYFSAAQKIGTGLGMVIYFSFPVIVVLLSWFIEKQKPHRNILIASLGIIIGCLLIANLQTPIFSLTGLLLALLSGCTYAFYIVWNKNKLPSVHSLLMTGVMCLGSAVALGVYCLLTDSFVVPTNNTIWSLLLAMAFFATCLPSLFLLEAIKLTSANLVSILAVFEPVVTLTIGLLVLHEPATALQLLGAFIIMGSAYIAQQKKPPLVLVSSLKEE